VHFAVESSGAELARRRVTRLQSAPSAVSSQSRCSTLPPLVYLMLVHRHSPTVPQSTPLSQALPALPAAPLCRHGPSVLSKDPSDNPSDNCAKNILHHAQFLISAILLSGFACSWHCCVQLQSYDHKQTNVEQTKEVAEEFFVRPAGSKWVEVGQYSLVKV
jgi:hypothetical protein